MNEYERGYKEGSEHFRAAINKMGSDVQALKAHLDRAAIFVSSDRFPKPFTTLWLVLDGGIITPGHYDGVRYVALSGIEAYPLFWAVIPDHMKAILGEEI